MYTHHVLTVIEQGEDWVVEHPPTCPLTRCYREGRARIIVLGYDCPEEYELMYGGLDSLDVDWQTLQEGRYAIEGWWHQSAAGPWGPAEYDGGLTLIGPIDDGR